MDIADTLQNAVNMISNRVDTIENATNYHLILLIAILSLIILIVSYFIVSEILYRSKISDEKGKHHHSSGGFEAKSDIEKFLKILPNLSEELEKYQSYKLKADNFDVFKKNFEKVTAEKQKLSDQKTDLEKEKLNFQKNLETKDKVVSDKMKEI